MIYVHRYWVSDSERKVFPRNLHVQFHGREMHSLCFIPEILEPKVDNKHGISYRSSWIVTGCEDGTVRMTRYIVVILLLIILSLATDSTLKK